jgi:hypothetical protein
MHWGAEWIKVKYSTDFSTPLSKKVIILLNRAIREEKEEEKEKEMERSVEAYLAEGRTTTAQSHNYDSDDGLEIDGDDLHMRLKEEVSSTPQFSKKEKKSALDRLNQFKDDMPSPYSPTSFSKVHAHTHTPSNSCTHAHALTRIMPRAHVHALTNVMDRNWA